MKIVDLHPEELIDKLSLGERELSAIERERLDAHLAQCSACRFELRARTDFEQDVPARDERPQLTFPSVTERTRPAGASPRVTASIRPRSRRRWPLVMLAAALVLCAGGATAAVITGAVRAAWLPWVSQTSRAAALAVPVSKVAGKAKHVVQKPAQSVEVEAQPAASAEAVAVAPPTLSAEPTLSGEPPTVASAIVPAATPLARPVKAARAAPSAGRVSSVAVFPSAPSSQDGSSAQGEGATPRLDPAAALFADANRARRDGNADRAVSLYRSLQSRYPGSSESELSRALLAQLLLDRGSPEAALAGFDRYLAQSAPVLGAEALVGRARALEQLGKSAQAAAAWREVQNRFPGSVHARLAATRLAALGMR